MPFQNGNMLRFVLTHYSTLEREVYWILHIARERVALGTTVFVQMKNDPDEKKGMTYLQQEKKFNKNFCCTSRMRCVLRLGLLHKDHHRPSTSKTVQHVFPKIEIMPCIFLLQAIGWFPLI